MSTSQSKPKVTATPQKVDHVTKKVALVEEGDIKHKEPKLEALTESSSDLFRASPKSDVPDGQKDEQSASGATHPEKLAGAVSMIGGMDPNTLLKSRKSPDGPLSTSPLITNQPIKKHDPLSLLPPTTKQLIKMDDPLSLLPVPTKPQPIRAHGNPGHKPCSAQPQRKLVLKIM